MAGVWIAPDKKSRQQPRATALTKNHFRQHRKNAQNCIRNTEYGTRNLERAIGNGLYSVSVVALSIGAGPFYHLFRAIYGSSTDNATISGF